MRAQKQLCTTVVAACVVLAAGGALGLSIYDIQYVDLTVDPAGSSPHDGSTVNCEGGIVVHKYGGSRPKVTLQDPTRPDGWGGIALKDWTVGQDMFNALAVGDQVTFYDVVVEEYRGNTLLRYGETSSYAINESGKPLPAAKHVSLSEIAAPIEGPPGDWYVADHSAEQYEAMQLIISGVTVTAMGLGKAGQARPYDQ